MDKVDRIILDIMSSKTRR